MGKDQNYHTYNYLTQAHDSQTALTFTVLSAEPEYISMVRASTATPLTLLAWAVINNHAKSRVDAKSKIHPPALRNTLNFVS